MGILDMLKTHKMKIIIAVVVIILIIILATTLSQPSCTGEAPLIPSLSSNSQNGYIVTASNYNKTLQMYFPYNAFKSDTPDGWVNVATTGWLQIELPKQAIVSKVELKARQINNRNITSWKLLGSNDGTTFETLLESNTVLPGNAPTSTVFPVMKKKLCRFYRFEVVGYTGSPDVGLRKMQLHGCFVA